MLTAVCVILLVVSVVINIGLFLVVKDMREDAEGQNASVRDWVVVLGDQDLLTEVPFDPNAIEMEKVRHDYRAD